MYTVILNFVDDRKINFSRACKGSLIFRQEEYPDIRYKIICEEPFQKKPQIAFLDEEEEVIFRVENALTPQYVKSLSLWQQALLIFLGDINQSVLNCKKSEKGYYATELKVDLDEQMEMALIS